jgi:hypothetical protein
VEQLHEKGTCVADDDRWHANVSEDTGGRGSPRGRIREVARKVEEPFWLDLRE